jgi:hypothetical protein
MLAMSGMDVVVLPMLSSVPSKGFLGLLHELNCGAVFVPDNDSHRGDHMASFHGLCGKHDIRGYTFQVSGIKDFGEFFDGGSPRAVALAEAKRLRNFVQSLREGAP